MASAKPIKEVIGRTPVYLFGDGEKAIICLHGFGGSKDAVLPFKDSLGFPDTIMVFPDAWGHGERAERDPLELVRENPVNFARMVKETGDDVRDIVSYLLTEKGVEKIGVIGFSMGGMIVFRAIAVEKRLSVAVAAGAGSVLEVFRKSPEIRKIFGIGCVDVLENDRVVREADVVFFAEKCPPTPLLLIGGRKDIIVPPESVFKAYEALEKAYKERGLADKLVLKMYDAGHEIKPGMMNDIRSWVRRWQ